MLAYWILGIILEIKQLNLNYNFIQFKGYFLNTKEYPYFCTSKIKYLK
jgi:hypothetical protein